MATIDRTINGGGTVGHPSRMPSPYVVTSQVHDTADGGTGGDVIQLVDVPADTMIVAGALEVLEARGNSQITLDVGVTGGCLLYTSPSPRDVEESRMPSSA